MQRVNTRLPKSFFIFLALIVILSLAAPTSMWASTTQKTGAQAKKTTYVRFKAHSFNLPPDQETRGYVPNELLVKFDKSVPFSAQTGKPKVGIEELAQALNCFDLTAASEVVPGTYKLSGSNVDVIAAANALEASEDVSFAVLDYIRHVMLTPNDEQYVAQQQWGVTQIKAEQAWDVTTGSENIIIAILDTGTAANHPDLEGKVIGGHNFVNNSDNASDDFGHGTYTAGIAAAASNNGKGVVGVSWGSKIMPVKVLSNRGYGSDSAIAQGIHWAVDNGARIINASLGGDADTPVQREAAQYAYDHNVLLVASAGNTPDGKPQYPAGYDTVLAVGASGRADTYTGFSSFGGYVGVSAPGVGILSTSWDNGELTYEYGNGTSASAPFVSGIAALVWSANPSLTAQQVRQIIEDSSDDLGDPGRDEHYGYGRVNAFRAVQMAQQGPRPTHTPTPAGQATNTPLPTGTKGPARPPTIQVGNTNVAPGVTLSIIGAGFGPSERIDLQVTAPGGKPDSIGNVQAGPQGDFRAEVVLPKNLPTGKVTLSAVGATSSQRANIELNIGGSSSGNGGQSRVQGALRGGTLTGAIVSLMPTLGYTGPEMTARPGSDNSFSFSGIAAGIYALSASAQGYLPAGPYIIQVDGTPSDSKNVDVTLNLTKPTALNRVAPLPNTATQVYFDPVGHTLNGPFLKFWQSHGGLAVFGYPISEEFGEVSQTDGKTYLVQYFERNRFEYHPEFAGTPNEVLMGLLGVDMTRSRTFAPDQPFQSNANNVFFNETRHSLNGPFLNYWKSHGGLAIFGYPISEPLSENGYLAQYFERNRFEYHPEFAGTPNEVLLGLLGVETAHRNGWLTP